MEQKKAKSLTIIAHPTHPSGFSFYYYLPMQTPTKRAHNLLEDLTMSWVRLCMQKKRKIIINYSPSISSPFSMQTDKGKKKEFWLNSNSKFKQRCITWRGAHHWAGSYHLLCFDPINRIEIKRIFERSQPIYVMSSKGSHWSPS